MHGLAPPGTPAAPGVPPEHLPSPAGTARPPLPLPPLGQPSRQTLRAFSVAGPDSGAFHRTVGNNTLLLSRPDKGGL